MKKEVIHLKANRERYKGVFGRRKGEKYNYIIISKVKIKKQRSKERKINK